MDQVKGNMEMLSSMQLTKDMAGMDAESKELLRNKEVLAVILQEVVAEYKGYSREEVMEFIEPDTVTDEKEVSPGRTNSKVVGDSAEFAALNEKVSYFDLAFRARNPDLSTETMRVSLHVDVEAQKTYRPGYPVEKRGIYYLARRLSAQLSLLTETTDYDQLEKCYRIWICREDIPQKMKYSVSVYEITNTEETSPCRIPKATYDLMTLVVIKLGDAVYNGKERDEHYELLHFLSMIMYPHKEDFVEQVSRYIDFSGNQDLQKEVQRMSGLGESIYKEGKEKGWEEGKEEGKAEGRAEGKEEGREEGREEGIQALILDNLEEKIPMEKILAKLQKRFHLTKEKAEAYYQKYAQEETPV